MRERSVCACEPCVSKRDGYVHACARACSRRVDMCAAELVSLPMRTRACMYVCVDRGTPGGWGVGRCRA